MRPLSNGSNLALWEHQDRDRVRRFVLDQDQAFRAAMQAAHPELAPKHDAGPLRITAPPIPVDEPISGIIQRVATMAALLPADLTGPQRVKAKVNARHYAMWLAYRRGQWSLPQIGKAFGGRDHTTVLNGVRRIQRLHDAGRLHEIMKGWQR